MVTWGLRCPASACSSERQEHACDGGKDKSKVSWESLSSSGDTRGDPSAQERAEGGWPSPLGWFRLSKHLTKARERLIYSCCMARGLY